MDFIGGGTSGRRARLALLLPMLVRVTAQPGVRVRAARRRFMMAAKRAWRQEGKRAALLSTPSCSAQPAAAEEHLAALASLSVLSKASGARARVRVPFTSAQLSARRRAGSVGGQPALASFGTPPPARCCDADPTAVRSARGPVRELLTARRPAHAAQLQDAAGRARAYACTPNFLLVVTGRCALRGCTLVALAADGRERTGRRRVDCSAAWCLPAQARRYGHLRRSCGSLGATKQSPQAAAGGRACAAGAALPALLLARRAARSAADDPRGG